jgi:hypothetical protein
MAPAGGAGAGAADEAVRFACTAISISCRSRKPACAAETGGSGAAVLPEDDDPVGTEAEPGRSA